MMMDQAVDVSSDLNLDDAFGLHPIHTGIEPRKYDMKTIPLYSALYDDGRYVR